MHIQLKQNISQHDGIDDSYVEDSEEDDTDLHKYTMIHLMTQYNKSIRKSVTMTWHVNIVFF